MASEYIGDNGTYYITLSKDEAVRMISLLSAQLADVALRNHQNGACPDITAKDSGKRFVFGIEK